MIPYRCHHCCTRHSRTRLPLDYRRDPKCPFCGHVLRVDYYRLRRRDRSRAVCRCGAAPYPHRKTACAKGWHHGRQPDREADRA